MANKHEISVAEGNARRSLIALVHADRLHAGMVQECRHDLCAYMLRISAKADSVGAISTGFIAR